MAEESGLGALFNQYSAAVPTGYPEQATPQPSPAGEGFRLMQLPNGGHVRVSDNYTDEQAIALIRQQRPELFEGPKPKPKPIHRGHAAMSSDETVHPSFGEARKGVYPSFDPIQAAINAEVEMTPEEVNAIPRAYKFAPPPPGPAATDQQNKQEALRAVLTGMPQVPPSQAIDPSKQGVIPALLSGAPEVLAGPLQLYGEHAEAMGFPGGQGALQYAKELSAKSKEMWQPTSDIQVEEARRQGIIPGAQVQGKQMAEEAAHFIGTWAPAIAAGMAEGVPATIAGGAYTFAQIFKGISDRLDSLGQHPKGGLLEKDINAGLQTAVFAALPAGMNKAGLDKLVGPTTAKIAEVFKTEGPEAAKAAAGSFLGNTFKSWAASSGMALPGLIATEEMTRYTTGEPSVSWQEVPGMVQSAVAMGAPTAPLHGAAVTARGRATAQGLTEQQRRAEAEKLAIQPEAEDIQKANITREWPEMRTEGAPREEVAPEAPQAPAAPAAPTGEINLAQPVDWAPTPDGFPNTVAGLKSFIADHKAKLQNEVAQRNPEVAAPLESVLKEAHQRLVALRRTAQKGEAPTPPGIPPSAETLPWPVEAPAEPAPVEPVTPEAPVAEAPPEPVIPEAPAVILEAPAPVVQPWPVEALGLKPNAALTKRLAKLDMNNPEHIEAISDELNKTRVQIEPEKLAALSNHFDALKPKEVPSAEQIPETGAPDGSGGPQPIIREEGGDQTISGKGVEPSGQGEQAPEVKAPKEKIEYEPLPELPPREELPVAAQTYHDLIQVHKGLLSSYEKEGNAVEVKAQRDRIGELHDLMLKQIETAKPKEAPPVEEQETPKWLQNHADDLGGTAVHNKGEIGLVRGYGKMTGEPVYVGAKGDSRTRIDIDHYTGKLFTPEELAHLRAEKARLADEDQAAHEANPEGPFAGKEGENLASTESVPREIHDTVKGWLDTLGISDRVHLATVEDAKALKGKVFGPFSRIPSQTLDDAFGSKRRLPNGVYSIVYKPHARMSLNLETLGHEIGHVLQDVHFDKAPVETQKAIRAAHDEWLKSTLGMDKAQELINSTRGHTTAKFIDTPEGKAARDLDPYWTNFREWFADQTGRWAMTDARPVGVVERFFSRLGQALRNFYQKNKQYLPHKTMADWINSLGPSKVEAIARPENPVQAWNAVREAGHPEWKNTSADVKQAWRDAFNEGAATKEYMNQLVGAAAPTEAPRQAGKVEPEVERFEDEESRSTIEPTKEKERPELTKLEEPESLTRGVLDTLKGTYNFITDPEYRAEKYARARQELVAESAGLEKVLRGKETYDPETGIRADFIRNQVDSVGHLASAGITKGFPYMEPATGLTRIVDSPRFNLTEMLKEATKLPLTKDYKGRDAAPIKVMGDILRVKMGEQELKEVSAARSKLARMERLGEASLKKKEVKEEMKDLRDFIDAHEAGKGKERLVKDEDVMWANQLLAKTPEAQSIVDRWRGLNDYLLDYAVATNWLSPETAELWKERWYAPMYKSMEDIKAGRETPGFPSGGPRAVGKVKGKAGSSQTVNIWENMARHYTYMLGNSMANHAKVVVYNQLERLGLAQRTSPEDKSANVVKMNMGGKPFAYKVFDADAFRSMTMLNMAPSEIVNFFAVPARWLRATSLMQPGFWYRTTIRDPIAANFLTTGAPHPWGPLRAIPITPFHAAYEIGKMALRINKEAGELKDYGVTGYYGSQARVENFAQGLASSGLMKRLGENIHKVHAAMDEATRVVVYKAAKAEAKRDGITDPQVINDIAALKAQEFTNFATRGHNQWVRQYGRITPFFHAQLAGMDKMLRQASGYGMSPKEAQRAKSNFISTAALMSAATMAYTFAMLHDKRYRDLPIRDWTNNFIIYDDPDENGDAHGQKLPIPQELGFMFKIIPEITMRYAMGLTDDAEAKKAFNTTFFDLMVPPGTLEGGGISNPWIRAQQMLSSGVDPHSGLPVESQYEAGLLPEDRDKRARIFGRMAGDVFKEMGADMSPDKFDAFMRTLFSTSYDYGSMAAEMIWDAHTGKRGMFELPFDKDFTERYPIAKDIYTNPRNISATPKFYEMAKPIYMTMNSVNKAAFEGDVERFNELTNDPDMKKRVQAYPDIVEKKREINEIERALTTLENRKDLPELQKRKLYWDNVKKRNEIAREGFRVLSTILMNDKRAKKDMEAGEKWHIDSTQPMELPEE